VEGWATAHNVKLKRQERGPRKREADWRKREADLWDEAYDLGRVKKVHPGLLRCWCVASSA
jgi:hypothetical protein